MEALLQSPQLWGLIAGLLLPALTAVVQQPQWSKRLRQLIAVVASTIAGTLAVLASGSVDPTDWITTVVAVIIASQGAYLKLWQPSGVTAQIEYKTSGYDHPEVIFETEAEEYDEDPEAQLAPGDESP